MGRDESIDFGDILGIVLLRGEIHVSLSLTGNDYGKAVDMHTEFLKQSRS